MQQISYFFFLFCTFLHKRHWKSIFWPAFWGRHSRTLVEIYNKCGLVQLLTLQKVPKLISSKLGGPCVERNVFTTKQWIGVGSPIRGKEILWPPKVYDNQWLVNNARTLTNCTSLDIKKCFTWGVESWEHWTGKDPHLQCGDSCNSRLGWHSELKWVICTPW